MAFIGDLQSSGAAKKASGSVGVDSLIVNVGRSVYFGADGYNANAGTVYIMIFDSATVPANGVVSPIHIIAVPTATNWAHGGSFYGEQFANGIVIVASSTALSTNWTLTIGTGADQFIECDYANEYGMY